MNPVTFSISGIFDENWPDLNYESRIEFQEEPQKSKIQSSQYDFVLKKTSLNSMSSFMNLDSRRKQLVERKNDVNKTILQKQELTKRNFLLSFKYEDENKLIFKQLTKIKYFWRGTNLNYPYAFQKIKKIKRKEKKGKIVNEDEDEDEDEYSEADNVSGVYLLEDFSKKLINPADKFLN